MIINVLMILALGIGLGTNQSIEGSSATTDPNFRAADDCYINGVWYNPCTSDPDHTNTNGGQQYQ